MYCTAAAKAVKDVLQLFGSEELFGYQCEFPVSCVLIKPRMQKYADKLTHRDILGAVLNLGTKKGYHW